MKQCLILLCCFSFLIMTAVNSRSREIDGKSLSDLKGRCEDSASCHGKAIALVKTGKLNEALVLEEKALSLDPDNPVIKETLFRIRRSLGNKLTTEKKAYEPSKITNNFDQEKEDDAFDSPVEVSAENENIDEDIFDDADREALKIHHEAVKLLAKGKLEKALEIEKKALEEAPGNDTIIDTLSKIHFKLGEKYLKKGHVEEAVSQFESSMEYRPYNEKTKQKVATIYLNEAIRSYQSRKYSTAKAYLRKAESYDDENEKIYDFWGAIYFQENDYNNAKHYWSKALRINPDNLSIKARLKLLEREWKIEEKYDYKEYDHFVIKFKGQNRQVNVDKLISVLTRAYQDVGSSLSCYPNEHISVIIYPKEGRRQLGYFPDWAGGLYNGKIKIGEDLLENTHLSAVLYHEYTHVLVHIMGGRSVPLWLNEGLAEYEARDEKGFQLISENNNFLREASKKNRLIPAKIFFHAGSVSRMSENKKLLMYLQSESFVSYLIQRYSIVDLQNVVKQLGKGGKLEPTISRYLYSDLDSLYNDWRRQL